MRKIYFIFAILLISNNTSYANVNKSESVELPENFYKYHHYVVDASKKLWKDLLIDKGYLKYIFAQVEQETCITLRHRNCWSPYAELKTDIEYAFGFGQITIAYKNVNGKKVERFNNFINFKNMFPEHLRNWKWEDRYNPYYQALALILYNKYLFNKVYNLAKDDYNRFCFMLSSYNGGYGWLLKDILLCQQTKGCNPYEWFDNVEKYSLRKNYKMYGRTPFDINREYVRNIMKIKYKKYEKITNEIILKIKDEKS